MTTLVVKDASGATVYLKGTGAGTELDPFVAEHSFALPANAATATAQATAQATLAAIQSAAESIVTATAAIKTAAEALNTKTTAVNTGAIAGTVALDGPTLAALETITAAISGTVGLDAGTLAALETINAVVSGDVSISNFPVTQNIAGTVALDAGTLAALENITAAISNFPATQAVTGPLTDSELRATPVPVSAAPDDSLNFARHFGMQRGSVYLERSTGRVRITIEAGTLPNVTTVGTVSNVANQSSLGGVNATPLVRASMNSAWSLLTQRIYS